MIKKKDQQLTSKEAERLLTQQTIVILNAVDEKLGKVDEKLGKMEIRINQKFDRLTTTLDKFLE